MKKAVIVDRRESIIVSTLGVDYQPAQTQEVPVGRTPYRVVGRGTLPDHWKVKIPARFILRVKVGQSTADVRTERQLRELVNLCITARVRHAYAQTMPSMVVLVPKMGQRGTPYWSLADEDAAAWTALTLAQFPELKEMSPYRK